MTLTIEDGIVHLDRAIGILGPDFPGEVEAAGRTAERVRGRVQVGGQHTVVVLAGATGSGKSSLLNALAGESVSRVAPTRPTTDAPLAVSGSAATEVLDWMGVDSRRVLPGALGEDRLVVVDLPDLDSIEHRHRSVADSLIERADAVVFVLDPQKYADAVIHKEYLERFMERGAACIVVLNQVDRLAAAEREGVLDDVSALLDRDGLDAQVFVASARTGEGVPAVRQALLDFVGRRDASRLKLAKELRAAGQCLDRAVREDGGRDVSGGAADFSSASQAIAAAAGVRPPAGLFHQAMSVLLRPGDEVREVLLDRVVETQDCGEGGVQEPVELGVAHALRGEGDHIAPEPGDAVGGEEGGVRGVGGAVVLVDVVRQGGLGPGGELAAPGAEDDEQVVVEVDDVDRAVPEAGEDGAVGVELVLQLVARQP